MTEIRHYGTKRHSGRYPWGSGEDPEQRHKSFLGYIKTLRDEGLSDKEIAKGLNMTLRELRQRRSVAITESRKYDAALATRLRDKGMSYAAIGRRMGGINESSVRSLLDPVLQERANVISNVADRLREVVEEKRYVDVGSGVEVHLGIARTKFDTALSLLKDEGYNVYFLPVKQQFGVGKTSIRVLAQPDVTYTELAKNYDKIKLINDFRSEDGGRTWTELEPIQNVDSNRVKIRYAEEGGIDKDGVIELRRGVPDISLGHARYAQVRIGVDGTHYMKGMAMYADDIPDGYDIVYNSNKKLGTPKNDVFKPQKVDKNGNIIVDDPFGSYVTQKRYIDSEGKERLSPLNIVADEGTWADWHKTLSSQMLSKQRSAIAKKQLDESFDMKKDEFDEIMSLTNPAVKKRLLEPFADSCDSAAVHLKAAALPRQGSHVILPFPKIKENEIYAPNFRQGENVVLIRHPHGGIFEIPELIVNNKFPDAVKAIGNARDAVGIHPKVAGILSGADFDGDTVLVIPNKTGAILKKEPVRSLMEFDPKAAYKLPEDAPKMKPKTKQVEMGKISNLITDMTIQAASIDEITRAVKHSMVVIDAEKHHLDYKRSFVENGIASLKKKYQGGEKKGAATLISRSKSEIRVPEREYLRRPDPITGKKLYKLTEKTYKVPIFNKKGPFIIDEKTGKKIYLEKIGEKVLLRMQKISRMMDTDDAFDLSSGTRIEAVYATHANKLKALANQARLAADRTRPIVYSPLAKVTYNKEVEDLKRKLNIALKHSPFERQAQLLATKYVNAIREDNPDMDDDDLKKHKAKALTVARNRFGGRKTKVEITDREWEAIQAGAISNNLLKQILLNADLDKIKQRALPRNYSGMSPAKVTRARTMLDNGHTRADIAEALGVSLNTLDGVLD